MTIPSKPKLLLVDDGERYIEVAHTLLRDYDYATRCELRGPCWECPQRNGCQLTHAHDASEADAALARHPEVDVVLLDVAFDLPAERLLPSSEPNLDRRRRLEGLAILRHLRRRRGDLPIVLMTSREELALEQVDEAFAADELVTLAGADAFDARALSLLIERVLARRTTAPELGGFVWGKGPEMQRLQRDALTLARTSLAMLILGETGTGKSAFAERVVHPASRRSGRFVAADLGAIPPQLVASELFGTTRGAFSGAVERDGLLAHADGGTLFLDEIGNLPLEAQRALLTTLQERRVTRLGDTRPRPIDVKLVAATNADLPAMVAVGTFRADLHARLNPAAALRLPPLRERIDDVPVLMEMLVRRVFAAGPDRALLAEYLDRAGLSDSPRATLRVGRPKGPIESGVTFVLPTGALGLLVDHPFVGNVRELELLVANATVLALADALGAITSGRAHGEDPNRLVPISTKLVRELLGAAYPSRQLAAHAPLGRDRGPAARLGDVARELERDHYRRLFRETGGDFEAMAARLLTGDPRVNARRVRLRLNQLGLSTKNLRIIDS